MILIRFIWRGILIEFFILFLEIFSHSKANHTIGFRIPWTLNDPDNWYHTHRFGGKCMVIGGIIMILYLTTAKHGYCLPLHRSPPFASDLFYLYYRKS